MRIKPSGLQEHFRFRFMIFHSITVDGTLEIEMPILLISVLVLKADPERPLGAPTVCAPQLE